jgi:hypothetical protein
LAKALRPGDAPGAQQRLAVLLKSHVDATGARVVKFDREWASTLRLKHGANVAERARCEQDMELWQQTSLLPARYEVPKPLAKAVPWAMHPTFGFPPSEAPAAPLRGPELRKAIREEVGEGREGRYVAAVAADLVQREGLTIDEARGWKRDGRLELSKAIGDDVHVQPPLGAPRAALVLSPAELGKTSAATAKPGYGHHTAKQMEARRVADLARLAQMGR